MSYYFRPDPRHRPAEWTDKFPASIRLPRDPAERRGIHHDIDPREYAIAFAEAAPLYAQLITMRGQSDAAPVYPKGSLRWLIEDWKKKGSYGRTEAATRTFYDKKAVHLHKWADDAARASGGIHHHIERVTPLSLYNFLSQFDDRPTLRGHLKAMLHTLFAHAVLYGHIPANIVREVQVNRRKRGEGRKTPIVLWTQGFVDDFVAAAQSEAEQVMAALVLTMWDIGQRPTDLWRLTALSEMEHHALQRGVLDPGFYYNPFKQTVIGWQQKTQSFVDIPLDPATLQAIEKIAPADRANQRHVFVHPGTGEPFDEKQSARTFRAVADRIGWTRATFRQGRHSCIVRYLRVPNINEIMVRTISGHDDIDMIRKKYGVGDSDMAAEAARRRTEHEAG